MLNEGLKKIGSYVFRDCQALQRITVPSTVDEISSNAFIYCDNLRDVVLNDGIKKIKKDAFGRCTSLERITIRTSTVVAIDQNAFDNCTNLREVVLYNEETQIGHIVFTGCRSLERFKFPSFWTRLDNIIRAGQRDIEAKLDNISSVEWRGGELGIPAVHREIEDQRGRVELIAEVDKEKLTTK